MEFNKTMDKERGGDQNGVFGLSLCERRREDLKDVDERDLGPKTKETELRLGLPGDWLEREIHLSESRPSDNVSKPQKNNCVGAKRAFWDAIDGFYGKEGNSHTGNKSVCLPPRSSKTQPPSSSSFLPSSQRTRAPFKPNPAVPKEPAPVVTEPDVRKENTSEQRVVVGWPPLRSSFRKNFAGSSSKPPVEKGKQVVVGSINGNLGTTETVKKGLFVKINMDGVPIGRKTDLHAYDSYQKLAMAVDGLFRGLLAAQNATDGDHREEKPITGLLDGSGEYTLVYQDNEGDRMLVGDVPWGMFVTSVKRLRVLKSCDLSALLVPPNDKHSDNNNPTPATK